MTTVNDLWSDAAYSTDDRTRWSSVRTAALVPISSRDHNEVKHSTSVRRRESLASVVQGGGLHWQPPVLRPPRSVGSRHFVATGRWEGAVVERLSIHFVADVIDLKAGETATAEFDIADLSPADVALCEPVSLFYWTIGYDVKDSGQRSRTSVITFRRTGIASAS